jgi:lysophospholipase L1-like esterase
MPGSSRVPVLPIVTLLALVAADVAASPHCTGRHWVGVWAASPSDAAKDGFTEQSLRLIVTPTFGGRRVRVRLSNRFGRRPVTFAASWIARRESGATLVPRSSRRLRFGGRRTITIQAGEEVVSDSVPLRFEAFHDLAVGLYVRGASGPATEHMLAFQTSYASPPGSGDHTGEYAGDAFTVDSGARAYLMGVEVLAPDNVGAVVTLGDSITDGTGSPENLNERYTDFLARRLIAAGHGHPSMSVLNAGLGGTGVLGDSIYGPSAPHRLRADVIDQPGARVVIVMDGTNDTVAGPGSAGAIIAALRTIVDQLHDAHLAVLLGTITPSKDTAYGLHGSPDAIAVRNQVNDWIRTGGGADGVVDFHAALRDPNDPDRLRPEYDSGDHLHPSVAGYQAMALAVDLGLLRGPACARSGQD